MPTIKIDSFSGIMPRVHPTLLPDGCAVKAHNCLLKSGKLSVLKQPLKVTGKRVRLENGLQKIADANSLYLWRRGAVEEFLAWPGVVIVAQGNIADDALNRVFVSGATGVGGTGKNHPCAYIAASAGSGFARHTLVKASLAAPTVTVEEGQPADADNIRYTAFFQTWVDAYGYESGVSLPSDEVEYNEGNTVTIAAVNAPSGAALRRIYKVVTGTETERIQFIYEDPIAGVGFSEQTFKIKDEDAGEVIPMTVSPPEDLTWMTYVPGNYYAGVSAAKPRTVMFSDVNRPTSWPVEYQYDIRDNIVGLAVVGNTVFAMTEGYPWAITGTAPESMSAAVLPSPQACVSSRSICVMSGAAFYASADGICMLRPDSDVIVLTEKYFGKREWSALNPETCIMDTYDGALYCWFTLSSGIRQGYIIDLGEGVSAITTHNEQAKAAFYDARTDSLYYVRGV
jgi:hypothetical protein